MTLEQATCSMLVMYKVFGNVPISKQKTTCCAQAVEGCQMLKVILFVSIDKMSGTLILMAWASHGIYGDHSQLITQPS